MAISSNLYFTYCLHPEKLTMEGGHEYQNGMVAFSLDPGQL
jgi:hypothetical protein